MDDKDLEPCGIAKSAIGASPPQQDHTLTSPVPYGSWSSMPPSVIAGCVAALLIGVVAVLYAFATTPTAICDFDGLLLWRGLPAGLLGGVAGFLGAILRKRLTHAILSALVMALAYGCAGAYVGLCVGGLFPQVAARLPDGFLTGKGIEQLHEPEFQFIFGCFLVSLFLTGAFAGAIFGGIVGFRRAWKSAEYVCDLCIKTHATPVQSSEQQIP